MNHENAKLNRSIPIVLSFFLVLTLLPSVYYPNPTLYNWINSDPVKNIYWVVVASLFVIYGIIVWSKNHIEPPLRYGLMFLWVLIYTVLLIFVHDHSMTYIDSNGATQTFSLSLTSILMYGAETLYDLFFAFSFLFLWPYAKKEPKFKNVFPYLVILIAVASTIFGFIQGPESRDPYLVYTSFYKSNESLGKALFAGAFAAGVLGAEKQGKLRWVFLVIGFGLILSSGFLGLSITFWALVGATFFIALVILNSPKGDLDHKAYRYAALAYVLAIIVFALLMAIPSDVATSLRVYFGNEFTAVWADRSSSWSRFLNSLSSWRLFIGDGAMGYYRSNILAGNGETYASLNSGIMSVYNGGGLVYLMFYVLIIVVGLARFKHAEGRHSSFYAVVLAFTGAFLLYTVLTDERLLFSSHYLSFVVSYLFMCYPRYKDAEDEPD
jgi:hypothetical protein